MKYAIALVALLSGCVTAPPPPIQWARADAGAEDLYRDRGQCNVAALSIPEQANVNDVMKMVFDACMRGKGWREVK